jgi:hypothetical protein
VNFKQGTGDGGGWKWMMLAGLLLAAALVWRPGCRHYPQITSPQGMQLVKLLYTACNTRDLNRLESAEKQLAAIKLEGKISASEIVSFEAIIAQAKRGEWAQAEKASFRFIEDQVGRGHPAEGAAHHDHDH